MQPAPRSTLPGTHKSYCRRAGDWLRRIAAAFLGAALPDAHSVETSYPIMQEVMDYQAPTLPVFLQQPPGPSFSATKSLSSFSKKSLTRLCERPLAVEKFVNLYPSYLLIPSQVAIQMKPFLSWKTVRTGLATSPF